MSVRAAYSIFCSHSMPLSVPQLIRVLRCEQPARRLRVKASAGPLEFYPISTRLLDYTQNIEGINSPWQEIALRLTSGPPPARMRGGRTSRGAPNHVGRPSQVVRVVGRAGKLVLRN